MSTNYAYPLQIDPLSGSLKLSSDADHVRDLIIGYIEIERGEVLGNPSYGLPDYLFSSYSNFSFVGSQLERRLRELIPDSDIRCNSYISEEGGIIEIFWAYLGEEQEKIIFLIEDDND